MPSLRRMILDKINPNTPKLVARLRKHFGTDPASLPIVSDSFPLRDLPDIHRAIESLLSEKGRSHQLLGVAFESHKPVSLADIVAPSPYAIKQGMTPDPGPVRYRNVALGDEGMLACVERGLYLVRDPRGPLALLVSGPCDVPYARDVYVHTAAPDRALAETFLSSIRDTMRKRSVYRGRVLSLYVDEMRQVGVHFHRLAKVSRDAVILPRELLDRIERQTIRFARLGDALRASGQHLKRGLLFYGPPGTGKTFTAMYLASEMAGRTVILVTGRGMGLIEQACAMARALQPATVIVEDVDLIAEERGRSSDECATPVLFELLNQMDGLADDADILFLLTTNRPEALEPALAARPGRVDQAIEIPLPDAQCRNRLVSLYGRGLKLDAAHPEKFIARTEGVSAAFIREWLRRAALFAADSGSGSSVRDEHLDEALHELLVAGGPLTRNLLGARDARA